MINPPTAAMRITKLYKIQNITVIENSKLENEEDFAENIAKAFEEAYLFSVYFGI